MNYKEMSYQEINHKIDIRLNGASHKTRVLKDYCNNPSNAWPIILENRIRLSPNPTSELWTAENDIILYPFENGGMNFVEHKNPLRAAMIVFLMMGEGDEY